MFVILLIADLLTLGDLYGLDRHLPGVCTRLPERRQRGIIVPAARRLPGMPIGVCHTALVQLNKSRIYII